MEREEEIEGGCGCEKAMDAETFLLGSMGPDEEKGKEATPVGGGGDTQSQSSEPRGIRHTGNVHDPHCGNGFMGVYNAKTSHRALETFPDSYV